MATLYVAPTGAGDRSGSSWANAAQITSLNTLIKKAGPDGQVLLRADAGSYAVTKEIPILSGGSDGHPVVIRGVDRNGDAMKATIVGDRPKIYAGDTVAGNELFRLLNGANNLKFQDMLVKDTGVVFRAGADISRITIDDVDATNVSRFFQDYKSGAEDSATVSRLTIRDVDIKGFSTTAIRLQYDTNAVKIENVHADAAGQIGDPWITGIHMDGTVHNVTIRDTSMANAKSVGSSTDYWNGDGYATERGVHDVTFINTVARGNTDGGYDLKSSDTTLIRALSEGNGKNYRFWADAELIDSVGLNPRQAGGIGKQNQLWFEKGADVDIIGSTFRDASLKTTVFAGKYGSISFDDVDTYHAIGTKLTSFTGVQIIGLSEIIDHLLYPLL